MFLQRLGHYHEPSTPFTASIAHTKLTRLCLTISVSSATAERSFSAVRTLKTFTIRSTTNASRLALCYIPTKIVDKMDLNDLCQTFVSSCRPNKHRVSLANRRHEAYLTRIALLLCMWIIQCVSCITANLYGE